eukprot:m.786361 g.786361  ORF g.786361 m.786361 type:complete len:398 (+) comp23305_c1_seq33:219-1412(+)
MMSPSNEGDDTDIVSTAVLSGQPPEPNDTASDTSTPSGPPQIVLVDAEPAKLERPIASPQKEDNVSVTTNPEPADASAPQKDMAAALAPLTQKKPTVSSDGILGSIDSFMSWGLGAMTKMEKMTMEAAETAYDATRNAATSTINSVGTLVVPKISSLKIVVSSIDPSIVNGMRIGLERVFGLSATLRAEHRKSGIAIQPVGLDAARKANENKISATTPQADEVVVAMTSCLLELTPSSGHWVDTTVMALNDHTNGVRLEVLSQGVPVSTEIVEALRERTVGAHGANNGGETSSSSYEHNDTGFSVTYDAMFREHKRKNSNSHAGVASTAEEGVKAALTSMSSDWHLATCGLEYEQILVICSTVLLGKYRRCLVEMTKAAAAASKRGDNDTPMSQQPK